MAPMLQEILALASMNYPEILHEITRRADWQRQFHTRGEAEKGPGGGEFRRVRITTMLWSKEDKHLRRAEKRIHTMRRASWLLSPR